MKRLLIVLLIALIACTAAAYRNFAESGTDKSVYIRITSTDGSDYESGTATNLDAAYYIDGASSVVTSACTAGALNTHTDWSIVHVRAGVWQLDLPDAAFASEGKSLFAFIDANATEAIDAQVLEVKVVDPNYWQLENGTGPLTETQVSTIVSNNSAGAITYEIASVTSQTEFVLTSAPSANSIRPGDTIRILDDSESDAVWSTHTAISYDGSSGTLIISGTPEFTVGADDSIAVIIESPNLENTWKKVRVN